jgi:hypothetical protein
MPRKEDVFFQVLTGNKPCVNLLPFGIEMAKLANGSGVAYGHSGYLPSDRNNGIIYWLDKTDCKFLVQVDHDMTPPLNILELADHDVELVGVPYLFMGDQGPSISGAGLTGADGIRETVWPGRGMVEVEWFGTGAYCIRRDFAERMISEYGMLFDYDTKARGVKDRGTDVFMCIRARRLGYKVWWDRDMVAGHLKEEIWVPMESGEVRFVPPLLFWKGREVPEIGNERKKRFEVFNEQPTGKES